MALSKFESLDTVKFEFKGNQYSFNIRRMTAMEWTRFKGSTNNILSKRNYIIQKADEAEKRGEDISEWFNELSKVNELDLNIHLDFLKSKLESMEGLGFDFPKEPDEIEDFLLNNPAFRSPATRLDFINAIIEAYFKSLKDDDEEKK